MTVRYVSGTMRLYMQGAVTQVRVCRCAECRPLTYCIVFDHRRWRTWEGVKTVSPLFVNVHWTLILMQS